MINPIIKQIKQMCAEKGISQLKMAEMSGYTVASISRWFSGKRTPNVDALEDMAKVVGASVELVIKRGDE